MRTDKLLQLLGEKLSAPSVHSGARCVSGPALVRTAPALPTPWNPNFHAPSSCPSLRALAANHNASDASASAPSAHIIGMGCVLIGWNETLGPMAPLEYYASTNAEARWSDTGLRESMIICLISINEVKNSVPLYSFALNLFMSILNG